MSIIRRVKSFSLKKYSSTDELKSNVPFRPGPRRNKTLNKEKSISMDHIPLHIELEKSDLFIKQKTKRVEEAEKEKHEQAHLLSTIPQRRGKLKKRKSVSFDEVRFSKCIAEFSESEVRLRRHENSERKLERHGSRYNTVAVLKDLITDCENEPKHLVDNVHKPGNFPLPEEEEVQIRTVRTVKPERPKTYAPTLTNKKEELLEFKGVVHLEIGKDICVKVRPKETLRILDGVLQLVDDRGNVKNIRANIALKRGTKHIGKKELEITDHHRTIYRLEFTTTKELKIFQEVEKLYHAIPSTSAFKNIGPWSQLRKLLKKRSSRDILESKGIIRNEPIFGNTLEELCDSEQQVPEVVTRIVELIEEPDNIKSVGLYRASANLAVVQNIRFEINCGRWDVLEKHRHDVDVLAGTLKLFFRELKQPLISYEAYQELHKAIQIADDREKIRKIIDSLPRPNRSTLLYIIKHLLKVCMYKEANKMDFHNISICWGPSLISLPDHCTDLVTQTTEFTKITEDLLTFYHGQNLDEPAKTPDFVYEVVQRLTRKIEEKIEVEGIYRKSGSNAKIEKMMKLLEKQNLTEVENGNNDIHDLCCVLKKYLATLRKKIVSDDFFHQYCEICDKVDDSTLRDEVRRMVAELPRKDIILLLFEHLQNVVLNESKNKMSFSILSDIWMTTLIGGTTNIHNYKKKMPKYSKLFLFLMNLNEKVLPDLVAEPKMRYWSKYDNVPDDIHNDAETSNDRIFTKL